MIFDGEDILTGSFDDVGMEVSLRTINDGFWFTWNDLFGKPDNNWTLLTVGVEQVEVLVNSNGVELSLEDGLLLGLRGMKIIVIVGMVE